MREGWKRLARSEARTNSEQPDLPFWGLWLEGRARPNKKID
jgi:hypothetical protein